MLADAIHALGAETRFYDPDASAPAIRRFVGGMSGPWTDLAHLRAFAAPCDVLTYEMEHIDTDGLRSLDIDVVPPLDVLETTQDRLREKRFLRSVGLPHVAFLEATTPADLVARGREFGFPLIVKTARGGYDGKGQWRARNEDQLDLVAQQLEQDLGPRFACAMEAVVDLEREVSCIVARAHDRSVQVFPVFENAHAHHILDWTLVPARISPAVARRVQAIARTTAEALGVVGLLTTEFFLSRTPARGSESEPVDGTYVYVNELAPRPHNSGHVTRRATSLSQFDALARIVLGAPVPEPTLRGSGYYCMGNLLGDVFAGQTELDLGPLACHEELLEIMLYGKLEWAPRRKMGHVIAHACDADRALAAMRAIRGSLTVTPKRPSEPPPTQR